MTNNNKFRILEVSKGNKTEKYILQKKYFLFGWKTIAKAYSLRKARKLLTYYLDQKQKSIVKVIENTEITKLNYPIPYFLAYIFKDEYDKWLQKGDKTTPPKMRYTSTFQGIKNQEKFYFGAVNKFGYFLEESVLKAYIQEKGYVYNRSETSFDMLFDDSDLD